MFSQSQGSRRAVSVPISRPNKSLLPGSKPLLFALFDILSGDVLLPRPSWVSYEPQVMHAGKKLFWVETDKHDRHTISGLFCSIHGLYICID